ncbi:MAG: hypothetical protein U9R01_00580 [candidate division WOR-3 bacterium]|nr:hypothetical protein [candidate division WOR-3 bacterium]
MTEDKIETIKEICKKKEGYLTTFKEILKIEKGEKEMPDHFGYSCFDIKNMNPWLLGKLRQEEILKCAYGSNKGKWFRLADNLKVEDLEQAIKEVEAEKEAISELAKEVLTGEKKEFLDWVEVTPEDIKEFEEILQEGDALDYFYPYICPKLKGMENQRKAVLLALASHWDEAGDRYRISVLMFGEQSSGTGKTPLLRWIKELGGGYVGMTATSRGLTVNLKTGSPGFFARFHHSVCAVDEIDKLEKDDRDGILQAAEEGIISFESAEVKGEYPAEAIILGGANDTSRFTPEQMGRWDFKFYMEQYSVDEAQEIADFVSEQMGKSKERETEKLMKFLKWIRSRKAEVSDDVRKEGAELIKEYIRRSGNTDIRRIQAIWRVARAWARLNRSDVTGEHVAKSIVMLEDCDKDK